jgi:hypothetical protein
MNRLLSIRPQGRTDAIRETEIAWSIGRISIMAKTDEKVSKVHTPRYRVAGERVAQTHANPPIYVLCRPIGPPESCDPKQTHHKIGLYARRRAAEIRRFVPIAAIGGELSWDR